MPAMLPNYRHCFRFGVFLFFSSFTPPTALARRSVSQDTANLGDAAAVVQAPALPADGTLDGARAPSPTTAIQLRLQRDLTGTAEQTAAVLREKERSDEGPGAV